MTYTVEQLAPGSYDVLRDGIVIASLVLDVRRGSSRPDTRSVELLDEIPAIKRPAPFMKQRHVFKLRSAALERLGIQEPEAGNAA
ncbi:hypothetical protein [Methylobacterium sp. J-070]|uniref:hypothetical protein n=1 Tax=Methylobacterium sp. J-070 TaxID=2836650 RepID=UPI001FBBA5E8|nr:hypothetical protein [Methylobacterium sp. J-070]MCJ2053813.1 hypothetical protein [Methylobacterium sp. J-070]